MRLRPTFLLLALLTTASFAMAQAPEGEWVSYRDAYRAMVVFEKYGKPKNLLQNHFQVSPRDKSTSLDGVQLDLTGKSTQINLALDATGRAVFPLVKAAYDENAVLVLNRKVGQYVFRPRLSITVQADGVYDAAELRAACDQALNYLRYANAAPQVKACVGVRLVYARKGSDPVLRLRKAEGEVVLQVTDGAAFADETGAAFRVVNLRLSDLGEKGQLVAPQAPLAIAALFE